jgi:glycosyltransferase involved in cell wall biosynthesis
MNPPSHEAARPLRIAVANLCNTQWIAGCHYLKNLTRALHTLDQPIEVVLVHWFPPADDSHLTLKPLVDEELFFTGVERSLPVRAASYLERRFNLPLGLDVPMAAFLRQHRIDALLHMNDMGAKFTFPLLVWVADFQHVNLPEMFTPAEIAQRDASIRTVAERAQRVILSSQNARDDFARFTPQYADKARVLSFVSQLPPNAYDNSPAQVCEKYHLPERFFYLPNQFWKHKNHQVVVEALAHLRQRFPQIVVVCTGNPHDYRNSSHFPTLLAEISRSGIRENFIILGMVPHDDIFPLMRQSLAVVQPSRFEGWSTTVEETKSLGTSGAESAGCAVFPRERPTCSSRSAGAGL